MSSSAIAFFTPAKKPPPKTPAERRAKARKAKARANTKSEEHQSAPTSTPIRSSGTDIARSGPRRRERQTGRKAEKAAVIPAQIPRNGAAQNGNYLVISVTSGYTPLRICPFLRSISASGSRKSGLRIRIRLHWPTRARHSAHPPRHSGDHEEPHDLFHLDKRRSRLSR